jgi:hypothetical protein
MNRLSGAVRGTGAKNIVMAGGLAYSNDLCSGSRTSRRIRPAISQRACYDSTIAPVAAKVPVILG